MFKNVNWQRLLIATLATPLLISLIITILILVQEPGEDSLLVIIKFLVFSALTLPVPFMLFVGVPTIIVLEKKRLAKHYTLLIYLVIAGVFPAVVIGGVSSFKAGVMFGGIGVFCGAITAFIMLYKRDDWHSTKSH